MQMSFYQASVMQKKTGHLQIQNGVQRVRKAVEPRGQAREDYEIFVKS